MYDLQKASVWKRISAALFDVIMLGIVIVGCAFLLNWLLGYDAHLDRMNELKDEYRTQYGIETLLNEEELAALSDDERAAYNENKAAAEKAFSEDKEVLEHYEAAFNLTLIIVAFSILIGYLLMEFVVPLLFKNGQTLGKKIFGVALMRIDGVKLPSTLLFARTVLGKCTVGTLLPAYGMVMILFGIYPILGVALVALPLLAQVILFLATKNHTPLHDLLAQTVAVDMASQLIFDSPEDLLEYKKRLHAEDAEKRER